MQEDYMEFEGTGLVPVKDGYIDKKTGNFITLEGIVYNEKGELIEDPTEDEDYDRS